MQASGGRNAESTEESHLSLEKRRESRAIATQTAGASELEGRSVRDEPPKKSLGARNKSVEKKPSGQFRMHPDYWFPVSTEKPKATRRKRRRETIYQAPNSRYEGDSESSEGDGDLLSEDLLRQLNLRDGELGEAAAAEGANGGEQTPGRGRQPTPRRSDPQPRWPPVSYRESGNYPWPAGIPPAPPKLDATFEGDQQQLPCFLAQIAGHMQEWGEYYRNDAARVRAVTARLSGAAGVWLAGLYEMQAEELHSLEEFLGALRQRFDNPFRKRDARKKLYQLRQGSRPVADFADEFNRVAAWVPELPEELKVQAFQEGLRSEILQWVLYKDPEETLDAWMGFARDAERVLETVKRVQRKQGGDHKKPVNPENPEKKSTEKPALKEKERRRKAGLCYSCGLGGHLAASCPSQKGKGPNAKGKPSNPTKPGEREKTLTARVPASTSESSSSEEEAEMPLQGNGERLL